MKAVIVSWLRQKTTIQGFAILLGTLVGQANHALDPHQAEVGYALAFGLLVGPERAVR